MAVDLDFIEVPGAGSNRWVWHPSDDDDVDADNFQHILTESQILNVSDDLPAVIQTTSEGTYYLRKQSEIFDYFAEMIGDGIGATVIQCGTKAGGPMDLLTAEKALQFNEALIPSPLVLYHKLGGLGGDFSMGGMTLKTPASTNARNGTQWILHDFTGDQQTDDIPWNNANINSFVSRMGIIESVKTGLVVSLSAPDGSDKQTLVVVSAQFVADDVGRPITMLDPLDPENSGIFEISDYVSPTSVMFVNADGVADAVGNWRWASVLNPLPIPRSNVRFTEVRCEGDLGDDNAAYNDTPVTTVDTAFLLYDGSTSVCEGTSTPPTNSAFAGWETQFAVVDDGGGARYFWHNFATRVCNGDVIIERCQIHRVGSAWAIEQWPEVDVGVAIELPSDAARPKLRLVDNAITECGLSPYNGSASMAYVLSTTGDVEISGNSIDGVIPSNQATNGLSGFAINHSRINTIDPTATSFFGSSDLVTDIGSRLGKLRFVRNTLNMGHEGSAAPAWSALVLRGTVGAEPEIGLGDPLADALWASAEISGNKFLGSCVLPLRLRGQNSISLKDNEFEGRPDSESIRALGCVNVRFEGGNVFRVRMDDGAYNVVLESSVNDSSVNDDLGQSLRVLSLGRAIETRGVVPTTDASELPTDPVDARPWAPG